MVTKDCSFYKFTKSFPRLVIFQIYIESMVNSCAAYGCNNRSSKEGNISFHKFPLKDKILCKKWFIATKHADFVPNDNSKLCSQHFCTIGLYFGGCQEVKVSKWCCTDPFGFPWSFKTSIKKKESTKKKRTHFTNLPHTSNRGLKKFISSAPANIHSKERKTSSQAPNPTSVSLFQTTLSSDKAPLIYSFWFAMLYWLYWSFCWEIKVIIFTASNMVRL